MSDFTISDSFTTATNLGVEEMIASIEMAQLTKGTVDALKTGVARDHEIHWDTLLVKTLADAVCQIEFWTADFRRDIWVMDELYVR